MDLKRLRHSASHIMAQAVMELYRGVKLGIGPAIEDGFYYDFDLKDTLTLKDLEKIEKRMSEIIKRDLKFIKKSATKEEAKRILKDQQYKLDLLKDIKGKITLYKQGDFIDLCSGPHIKSAKEIKAFKLIKLAGAYWRGDSKNKQMQRIYGVAFSNKKDLEDYLKLQEEAEKRSHIRLGKQLDIFGVYPEIGSGLVIWHTKGSIIRGIIENFWKEEHKKRDYSYIYTPHIGNLGLWKKSGHLQFYREYMYPSMKLENVEYLLKPMNCPFHIQVYKSRLRSYRELPIRYCELGTVYRYEISGALHGMTRVRGFTQDDAHIFCTNEQMQQELENVVEFAIYMMNVFGFRDFKIDLSIRDPKNKKKYLGNDKIWKIAEDALEKALRKKNLRYKVAEGEAVFYGPKIDIKLVDSLGREWQGPTIQVDFNFPEKFNLTYETKDGKKDNVVMIHRTVLGSMERFVGCLIEHYGGKFPLWLTPVQVKIITVSDKYNKYAYELVGELRDSGVRVEVDDRNESVAKKVNDAHYEYPYYIVTIGEKEIKSGDLAVRTRDNKIINIKKNVFIKNIIEDIRKRC